MSVFEQIIVPFIDETIKPSDLTEEAGFIDSFTYDIDHPTDKYIFFLVYDADLRNNSTIDRARRFDKSKKVRYSYIKFVNGKAWLVYSYWIGPEIKKMYTDNLHLTPEQKFHIAEWWGSDKVISRRVLMENSFVVDCTRSMPAEDYRRPPIPDWDEEGPCYLAVEKNKGDISR